MNSFLAFVKKEFFHIMRDRRTLLILFGMPVVQVILFGFAITNEIQDARIAILDQSKDEASREISLKLLSSGFFRLDSNLSSPAELEKNFQKGKTKLAVVFSPKFQQNLTSPKGTQVQLIADASDPNTATTLTGYATAIIAAYQKEKAATNQLPLAISTEVKMLYNEGSKSVFMFVPGVMTVILMLVSAMMTSIAITKEKELGTMEVLLVSPLKPALIVVGKVVPYILLALVNTGVILGLSTYVFGMPIRGNFALLLAECFLFVLTSLALGILISTKTESQQVALLLSLMGLMLPTILLSGFIFPVENMPKILQYISNIIPARWFIIIIKNVMLKGIGLAYVWKETLILGAMTFFFIGASVKNFKIRLE